jgi:hypothetical protein
MGGGLGGYCTIVRLEVPCLLRIEVLLNLNLTGLVVKIPFPRAAKPGCPRMHLHYTAGCVLVHCVALTIRILLKGQLIHEFLFELIL